VSSIYYENLPIGKGFTGSNCTFFRTEEVRYRKRDGQAKILGIVLCVLGALLMLIYKGPAILTSFVTKKIPPNSTMLRPRSTLLMEELIVRFEGAWGIDKWTLGGLCVILGTLSMSISSNLQVKIMFFPHYGMKNSLH
jgi:hypothetical protein